MNATLHLKSIKATSKHPLNVLSANLLRKAGETPSPTSLQPVLQLAMWAAENPKLELKSPNQVTREDVVEFAHRLGRVTDQRKVLKMLAAENLSPDGSPEEVGSELVLALADQLTEQSEPDSQT